MKYNSVDMVYDTTLTNIASNGSVPAYKIADTCISTCILPYTYPSYTYTYNYDSPDVKIYKKENGFLIGYKGKEYVFSCKQEMFKFLKDI